MNLITIFRRFPDQMACIAHLEDIRWGAEAHCPKCRSIHVARKCDGERVGRWNCHDCHASFNVLSGTIFEKTRVPLQKWFFAIGLMINAKKSLSSYQLARDLELTHQTALFMQQRIRAAMAADHAADLLHKIVEVDEDHVDGNARKGDRRDDDGPGGRHGGTLKMQVITAVEHGGCVIAYVVDNPTGKGIIRFLKETVDSCGSLLIEDKYKEYNAGKTSYEHVVINHLVTYANGDIHMKTIKGYGALLKRAWYRPHRYHSRRVAPLFVSEALWKHNHQDDGNPFASFLRGAMS